MAAFAAPLGRLPSRLRHLRGRHGGIAQQPRQRISQTRLPQAAHTTHAAATNLNQRACKKAPFLR